MALQNDTYGSFIPSSYGSPSGASGASPAPRYLARNDDTYPGSGTYETDPFPLQQAGGLQDRIFGSQLHAQEYTLSHLDDTLDQRKELHRRHLKQLKRRIFELQQDLSVANLHASGPVDKDRIKLKSQINQLEKQKRKEELDYWKDVAEIKKDTLETALQHEAARRRADLFQGLEL